MPSLEQYHAKRDFRRRDGVALVDGYGSTETNFVIATPPDTPRDDVMGWLRTGFDARVVDEHSPDGGPMARMGRGFLR